MPLIRRGDEYALIVSDGKLDDDVYYCIVREPRFNMKSEVIFVSLLIMLGLSICFRSPTFASYADDVDQRTGDYIVYAGIGTAIFLFGLLWACQRVFPQYRYRSSKIGRNVEVLTQDDPFWRELTSSIYDWPEIAKEMERETLLGRVLEGIILDDLYQLRYPREWSKHSLPPASKLNQDALATAQRVANAYADGVRKDRQRF